jgi:hypothetical protein
MTEFTGKNAARGKPPSHVSLSNIVPNSLSRSRALSRSLSLALSLTHSHSLTLSLARSRSLSLALSRSLSRSLSPSVSLSLCRCTAAVQRTPVLAVGLCNARLRPQNINIRHTVSEPQEEDLSSSLT